MKRSSANYQLNPAGIEVNEFVDAATSYSESVDPSLQPDVLRLSSLAQTYWPFFQQGDDEVSFISQLPETLNNLTVTHWTNLVAELLVTSYTGQASVDGPQMTLTQFESLFDDFGPIGVIFT